MLCQGSDSVKVLFGIPGAELIWWADEEMLIPKYLEVEGQSCVMLKQALSLVSLLDTTVHVHVLEGGLLSWWPNIN